MNNFISKIAGAFAGGAIGSILLVLFLFLTSSLLTSVNFNQDAELNVITLFLIMSMVFLASTISNLLADWFISLSDKKRYNRFATSAYQMFFVSIFTFLVLIPLYLYATSETLILLVGFHVIFTVMISHLIIEIVSKPKDSLVFVYGMVFGLVLFAAVLAILLGLIDGDRLLIFMVMPLAWLCSSVSMVFAEKSYRWIASVYDKDFLALDTDYGEDYGKQELEEEHEEVEVVLPKDKDGSDFLRGKGLK